MASRKLTYRPAGFSDVRKPGATTTGGGDDSRSNIGEALSLDERSPPVANDLTLCSLCLRVRRDKEWIDAERVIREMRTYEHDTTPRLHGAICDGCVDAILRRRAEEPLAA
jgi:hypothetical protein